MNWWYRKSFIAAILLPLSWIYKFFICLRRFFYKHGVLKSYGFDVPVIVVGNISVGGTGKTPLVVSLVKLLQQNGYKPGVVSRGYRGKSNIWPQIVDRDSDPGQVGDEAVMLVRQTEVPMVVDPNRPRAVTKLLNDFDCNIVISDDGLQHYALKRDLEIVIIDSKRGFGNEYCLPVGPLRESLSRLLEVDFVIEHYSDKKSFTESGDMSFYLKPGDIYNIVDKSVLLNVDDTRNKVIHAVCGIGHPQRFFHTLAIAGYSFSPHAYPDHHTFSYEDINFSADEMVIMTEKDAVKCESFSDWRHWCLPVEAIIKPHLVKQLLETIALLK